MLPRARVNPILRAISLLASILAVAACGESGTGPDPDNVSITFCPLVGSPIWVAFQDGPTGAWVRSTVTDGAHSGQISSGRGGIAYVTAVTGGGFQTTVRYGTTAELQALSELLCFGSTWAGKSVRGSVTGLAFGDAFTVALGPSAATGVLGTAPTFQNVPEGVVDLIGARSTLGNDRFVVTRLFAQRDLTPAPGSTVTVDFNASSAVTPSTAVLTINGLGSDQAVMSTSYRTANRTFLSYATDVSSSTATSRTFIGFPPFAGSFHVLQVVANPGLNEMRTAAIVFGTVAAKTITLGPDLDPVAVTTASTTPTPRFQAVIPADAPYNHLWTFGARQGNGSTFRGVAVHTSAGYVGGSPATVTVLMPDLGGASGYLSDWGLRSVSTTWQATGHFQRGIGVAGEFSEDALMLSAGRVGTITSP
jgi:hypothetical protein